MECNVEKKVIFGKIFCPGVIPHGAFLTCSGKKFRKVPFSKASAVDFQVY